MVLRVVVCTPFVRVSARGPSTHAFGVADALALARALGLLPPRVVVHAIRGVDFSLGAGLSPPVRAATQTTAALLAAALLAADLTSEAPACFSMLNEIVRRTPAAATAIVDTTGRV